MTAPGPANLRLFAEKLPQGPPLPWLLFEPLADSFERATGWELGLEPGPAGLGEAWSAPVDDGSGQAARLVLRCPGRYATTGAGSGAVDLPQVRPLAISLAAALSELGRLRRALWQREAELAAAVPVAARPDEAAHLAQRLTAVLQGGAEAIGCQAAGLYLLDEATTELKLRACWGLPPDRLLAPARPLGGAIADLEALVGHAVALEDTSQLPHWRCPEDFAAALCVPVSTPSIPLGTLWVFCHRVRVFSPQETNLIEIVAGRLAADLEREVLLAVGREAKSRDGQFQAAARWLADRLPSVRPLLDDYELAGWTRQASELGGDFHDWSVLPDGRLAVAVGDAEGEPLLAALGASSLHSAIKSHAGYRHGAAELIGRVNETLVAASPGDQQASLAYAVLEPESGRTELALAGQAAAMVVGPEEHQTIAADAPHLGQSPEAAFFSTRTTLQPGDVLLLVSSGVRAARDAAGLRIGENSIASLVARHLCESADALVARLRRLLEQSDPPADDLTVLVVKRRLS